MSKAKKIIMSGVLAITTCVSYGMVFDNRFFPLIQKPFISVPGRPSHIGAYLYATTASKAINSMEQNIGIPELYGKFDLGTLALAFDAVGLPNPLRSDLRGQALPFDMAGTIQAQGLEFCYYQSICEIGGIGFNWLVMHSNSRQEFFPRPFTGVDPLYLDATRRTMFQEMGLSEAQANQSGMGDLDLYMRLGYYWDYALKFKRIDAGVRLGALIPAGVTTSLNSPASVPFGGNGFWGFYGQLESEFEFKEDMKGGLIFRLSKRFSKTQCQRLPVKGNFIGQESEPYVFSPLIGEVKITPGYNLAFMPYAQLENLRAGLGVRLLYTLTNHWHDTWCDERKDKTTVPVDLRLVNELSGWKSDYISLSVFYDFGKVKVQRSLDPILIFTWDIPSLFFSSERTPTTNKVSLGLEYNF